MGFEFVVEGDFESTYKSFRRIQQNDIFNALSKYGQQGVDALASATPQQSGKTASSWYYEVEVSKGGAILSWNNRNLNEGVNIAIILQTGHGTGTGGYIQGIDYINPSARPIFDQIVKDVWREVTK